MQRFRSTSIASLFALVLLLKGADLRAQAPDANANATDYRNAYAAMAKEDWPKARELLLRVWDSKKTYDVAASLGQVEFKLKHYTAAARYTSFALANVAPSEKPQFIERLKNAMREVRHHVASIRVSVSEADAEVTAGDEKFDSSPVDQEVFLEPGHHVLVARKGARFARAEVTAKAGEGFEVTLTLEPEPAAAAPTSGLGVEAAPRASGDGDKPPNATKSRSVVPVVIGGAVAVASLATAIGLRLSANSSYDDAKALRRDNGPAGCSAGTASEADCRAQADANSSGDSKANVSTIAFAVAGGAVLATAAYWFWPRERPRLSGGVVPSGAFLTVSGDF